MCRGRAMYFSRYSAGLLNAVRASASAMPKLVRSDLSSHATRMPRPPPPAAALMMTGKPICFASAPASSTLSSTPGLPGTSGSPACFMVWRATALSPILRIMSGVGPMNVKPLEAHTSAKCAFSDRKP